MNVKDLMKAVKTGFEIYAEVMDVYDYHHPLTAEKARKITDKKWVSFEDVEAFLVELFLEKVIVPRKQLAPLKHDDFKCPKCDTLNHRIIRIITWTVLKDEIELKLVFFCEDCGHSEPVNLIKVLDEQERHKKLPPFIEKELLEATQK